MTCALVHSDNPQVVEVLRLFKPDRVFLAYEGRKLLEALKEFNVAVCTYIPFDVPRGATAGLSLSATPRSTKITGGATPWGRLTSSQLLRCQRRPRRRLRLEYR